MLMKIVRCLKTLSVLSALSCFAGAGLFAQEAPGGYLFFGTEASALVGKSYFPIVTMDKKNIYVDNGASLKKVSARTPCAVRHELVLTESFAEVLEMKFNTSSMRNIQRASTAVADMHQAQFQSEIEIARIQGFGGGAAEAELSETDQRQIEDIRQDNSDFQTSMQEGLDSGAFEAEELADTVHVRGTLIPQVDIEGAYCIVVVTYDRQDPASGEHLGRGSFARAKYIGDLLQEEIVELRVRCAFGEFNTDTAEYALHLFSKGGEQVAMSNSRGLKPLTVKEVAIFRELEAKTAPGSDS